MAVVSGFLVWMMAGKASLRSTFTNAPVLLVCGLLRSPVQLLRWVGCLVIALGSMVYYGYMAMVQSLEDALTLQWAEVCSKWCVMWAAFWPGLPTSESLPV